MSEKQGAWPASPPAGGAPPPGEPPAGQAPSFGQALISAILDGNPVVVTILAIIAAVVLGGLLIAFSDPVVLHLWSTFFSNPGAAISAGPGAMPYQIMKPASSKADTARSTRPGSTDAIGAETRGKYTLVTSWTLVTRLSGALVIAPEKYVHAMKPMYAKTGYGTEPLETFASRLKTNVKISAPNSGCRSAHTAPNAVCL